MEASVDQKLRRFFVFSCMAILALSLTIVVAVSAQVISAALVGTVLDKTSAAAPGATVETGHSVTGDKYNSQANVNGGYSFHNLTRWTFQIYGFSSTFATTQFD